MTAFPSTPLVTHAVRPQGARAAGASCDAVELSSASGLPAIDAATARALARIHACGPMALPPLRETATPMRVEFVAAPPPAGTLAPRAQHRFALGPHAGWLALDAPLLDLLLGERHADRLPRDLQYVLLADALEPLTTALESRLHLRLEWSPPAPDAGDDATRLDAAAAERLLHVGVDVGGTRHGAHVRFDHDAALAALAGAIPAPRPRAVPSARVDHLRIALPFVIGRTRLGLHELRSVRAGDIIRVEHWLASGAAVSVVAELGGRAGLRLRGLADGARITLLHKPESAMTHESAATPPPAGDADNASLPLERLDAFEVTLRFELADLSVPLGELRTLKPGHVFQLQQPLNRSVVHVAAHGNLLGKGYLVAVGDQLGVRISEFVPGDL